MGLFNNDNKKKIEVILELKKTIDLTDSLLKRGSRDYKYGVQEKEALSELIPFIFATQGPILMNRHGLKWNMDNTVAVLAETTITYDIPDSYMDFIINLWIAYSQAGNVGDIAKQRISALIEDGERLPLNVDGDYRKYQSQGAKNAQTVIDAFLMHTFSRK